MLYLERQTLALSRTTYQLNDPANLNIANYPTGLTLLWNEGSPNPDYGAAYSVYTKVESPRNVWASLGMHYDTFGLVTDYIATNSSWWGRNTSGKPFLVFGNYMSGEMDAVAHEYGHGVFRPLAGTPPALWWYDYHAINEFYSDLSALITKFTAGASPALAQNWRITSLNLRDHSNPKSIPSGNFQDWYPNRRFWGDTSAVAYSNSTIYGHALYLMIHGGTHARAGQSDLHGPIPSFSVTPTAASTIHSIFGRALLDMSATHTAMSGLNLKTATVNAANALEGPAVATQVNNAWVAVGIGYGCSAPPPTPDPVISPWYCRGTHDISWTQNPGDKYHGMVANPAGVWDLVGNTNIDIAANSCRTEVPGTLKFRMRACNACGCSNWTSDFYMYYYSPCL